MNSRPDVQGLRALAVVAVVVNHLTGHPRGGFVGVDIFFVISGYLITGLLLREHERTGRISYVGFYVRRFKRIIPAAATVVIATLIAAHTLTPGTRYASALGDARWSLLFAANWHFASEGTNYFAQGQEPSPFQHYWSLGVEEQFYLVWPWLMLALLGLAAARYRRVVVGVAVSVLSTASFIYAVHLSSTRPTWAYFSSFTRAWELGAGALVAIAAPRLHIRSGPLRGTLAWVGVIGALSSLWIVSQNHGFPAPGAALPVGFTVIAIVAGIGGKSYVWPLTNPVSRYVGDLSYSIYLWHFPVIVLAVALVAKGTTAYYVSSSVGLVVLAVISYHLIENPIRESNWLADRHGVWRGRVSPLGWASLVGASALAVLAVTSLLGDKAWTSVHDAAASHHIAIGVVQPGQPLPPCYGAADIDKKNCTPHLGNGITPSPADAPGDLQGQYDCIVGLHKPVKVCTIQFGGLPTVKIALVGDSHAAALIPALRVAAHDRGWQVDTYLGLGCRIGFPIGCDAMPNILRTIESKHYAAVLTTDLRGKLTTNGEPPPGISKALGELEHSGTPVIVIADVPEYPSSTQECTLRAGFSPSSRCATPLHVAISPTDLLAVSARNTPGVKLISLLHYFCTSTSCPAVIGNVLVYRDTVGHITATYSETLGPFLGAAVSAALG